MSDYMRTFAISASGLDLERLRLEVAANNLANAHTTAGPDGALFRPLRVIAKPASDSRLVFDAVLNARRPDASTLLQGVGKVEVLPSVVAPMLESDPGNPAADAKGFVRVPAVNPVEETLTVMTAVRAYEAGVRVMTATKAMALKALEIGGRA